MPTGTSGFGFEIPAFRMNQGVNASTANPMAREGAMQQAEPVMESQFGLNLDVMARAEDAAKTQFYGGVNELNNFINTAAQFGIDPTKVDMSNPESFALNKQYRDMMNSLQKQAQAIRSGAIGQIAAQNKADEEWQKSQRDRNVVIQKRQDEEYARQLLTNSRSDAKYIQDQLDDRVKKIVLPFATQLDQFLSLHLNTINQENKPAVQKEQKRLSNILDREIAKNKNDQQIVEILNGYRDQVNSVSVLTQSGGDDAKPMSDLSAYQRGAFSKNPDYKGTKLYGFEIMPNGNLKVFGTTDNPTFGGQAKNANVPPIVVSDRREIANIIAIGFGDSESDGKIAKVTFQKAIDEAYGGVNQNMMKPKK
jgi:hypothetical protein